MKSSSVGAGEAFFVMSVLALCFSTVFLPSLGAEHAYGSSVSANSICCGVGEGYELAWTYQPLPRNLTQAWINYYTNSTFQGFQHKFGWDIIRLGFRFSPNSSSSSERFLNISDFTKLDLAVSMASKYGFKVILDEMDYLTNFYGSTTWYTDWNATALHYKGNNNILFFEIANEMANNNTGSTNNGCGTIGTEAIVCLDHMSNDIRQIDSTRKVAWWNHSLPNWSSVPPSSELVPNLVIDQHIGDYTNGGSTCRNVSKFERSINGALGFQNSSGIPVIAGELNMQITSCESVGSQEIQYLVDNTTDPWIAWGYKTYSAKWIPILSNVNVTIPNQVSSTSQSTSPSTSTVISSTSRTSTLLSTFTTTSTSASRSSEGSTSIHVSSTINASSTQITSTKASDLSSSTTITNLSQSSTRIPLANYIGGLFNSLPFVTSSPTPLGTAIFVIIVGSITITPFAISKLVDRIEGKDREESHRWRW